ncbi:transposase [Vibrio splendidus]|uniref:transposase n=1 Tax=Vibrio splendidus TaxID=29497 RepID=UPI00148CBB9D|nr:transposase [Vibrio splendidus]
MKVKSQRQFTDEFKREAVQQYLNSSDTVKSVALSLGISQVLLSNWRCQMTSKKINSLPIPNQGPEKSVAQLEKEIRQLKKKLEMAELENDFLKEAKAFFDSQKE